MGGLSIDLKICNLTEEFTVDEVGRIADMFEYDLKNAVYLEMWSEKEFRRYFKFGEKELVNPLTGKLHKQNGWYNLKRVKDVPSVFRHEIALIMNDIWKKTLFHELMHCRQAENIGVCWRMLEDIFENKRSEDPFEFHAEYYAINKIKEMDDEQKP